MAYRFPTSVGTIGTNATGTGGESVLMNIPPISPTFDAAPVFFLFTCTWTNAAAPVNLTFSLRRGTLITGTLVAALAALNGIASVPGQFTTVMVDQGATLGPGAYVITVNNTNGGSSVAFNTLIAFAFAL